MGKRGIAVNTTKGDFSITNNEKLFLLLPLKNNLGKGNRPLGAPILGTLDQKMSTLASPKCQWTCRGEGHGGDEDTQMEMIMV